MEVNVTNCVICNRSCEIKVEKEQPSQHVNVLDCEKSLFKLFDINLNDNRSEQLDFDFNTVGDFNCYYCQQCQLRNSEISKIYNKIESLHADLHKIKESIEDDFKETFQRLTLTCSAPSSSSSFPNFMNVEERFNFIRCQLAKVLNISDSNTLNSIIKDEPESPFYPHEDPLEDEYESLASPLDNSQGDNQKRNSLEQLKQTFALKDFKIVLDKLPRTQTSSQSQSVSSSSTLTRKYRRRPFRSTRAKRKSKEDSISHVSSSSSANDEASEDENFYEPPPKRTKIVKNRSKVKKSPSCDPPSTKATSSLACIFDDCDHGNVCFASEEERQIHVKQVHEINLPVLPTSSIESKSNGADNESNNHFEPKNSQDCDQQKNEAKVKGKRKIPIKTTNERPKKKRGPYKKRIKENFKKDEAQTKVSATVTRAGRLKCPFKDCTLKKTFKKRKELQKHLKEVHEFQAPSATEDEDEDSNDDGDQDDPTNQYPYSKLQCPVEGCTNRRFFRSEKELARHRKKVHEGTEFLKFECNECGRRFRFKCERDYHLDSHSGIYRIMCEYCGKGFENMGALNVHLPKHTLETRFKCTVPDCNRAFRTASGLLYHVRREHEKYQPFKCETCEKMGIEKRFMSHVKLNNHIKSVHIKDRSFLCQLCGKGFTLKMYLQIHMKTHRRDSERVGDKPESTRQNTKTTTTKKQRVDWSNSTQGVSDNNAKQIEQQHVIDNIPSLPQQPHSQSQPLVPIVNPTPTPLQLSTSSSLPLSLSLCPQQLDYFPHHVNPAHYGSQY